MGYIDWPCVQTAVYWAPGSETTGGRDFDDYGKPLYTTPVELSVRWDDVSEEFLMADGTRDYSRAEVICNTVVLIRGVLFLGALTDVTDQDNPLLNEGAYEIRRVDKTPDIDGIDTLITAYL